MMSREEAIKRGILKQWEKEQKGEDSNVGRDTNGDENKGKKKKRAAEAPDVLDLL